MNSTKKSDAPKQARPARPKMYKNFNTKFSAKMSKLSLMTAKNEMRPKAYMSSTLMTEIALVLYPKSNIWIQAFYQSINRKVVYIKSSLF
jgi:hypothetical protein